LIVVPELCISLIVVPERYDINAGNIGRIHGDTNEPNPAIAETRTVDSTIVQYSSFSPSLSSLTTITTKYFARRIKASQKVLILFSKLRPNVAFFAYLPDLGGIKN
jgi:hypothetical protein